MNSLWEKESYTKDLPSRQNELLGSRSSPVFVLVGFPMTVPRSRIDAS